MDGNKLNHRDTVAYLCWIYCSTSGIMHSASVKMGGGGGGGKRGKGFNPLLDAVSWYTSSFGTQLWIEPNICSVLLSSSYTENIGRCRHIISIETMLCMLLLKRNEILYVWKDHWKVTRIKFTNSWTNQFVEKTIRQLWRHCQKQCNRVVLLSSLLKSVILIYSYCRE